MTHSINPAPPPAAGPGRPPAGAQPGRLAAPVFARSPEFQFRWANNIPATHPSTIRVKGRRPTPSAASGRAASTSRCS